MPSSGWSKIADKNYNVFNKNCATAVSAGLNNAGLTPTSQPFTAPGVMDSVQATASTLPAMTVVQAQEQSGSHTISVDNGSENAGQDFRRFDPPPLQPKLEPAYGRY